VEEDRGRRGGGTRGRGELVGRGRGGGARSGCGGAKAGEVGERNFPREGD